jgi:hypothetical protein
MSVVGKCLCCPRVFGFNPHKVPSFRVEGVREPNVLFSPGSFGNLSADLAVSMLEKLRVAGNEINLWETKNEG